jgi:hypothetical protein
LEGWGRRIMSSRLVWATEQDSVSKQATLKTNKQTKTKTTKQRLRLPTLGPVSLIYNTFTHIGKKGNLCSKEKYLSTIFL